MRPEPGPLEHRIHPLRAIAPALPVQPIEQREVRASGEIRIERRRLDEAGDGVGQRRSGVQIGAQQPDRSGVALGEPEEDAQQRGFAGAIRAQQAVHVPGPGRQVDPLQRLHAVIALADAMRFDGALEHAHASYPPSLTRM